MPYVSAVAEKSCFLPGLSVACLSDPYILREGELTTRGELKTESAVWWYFTLVTLTTSTAQTELHTARLTAHWLNKSDRCMKTFQKDKNTLAYILSFILKQFPKNWKYVLYKLFF